MIDVLYAYLAANGTDTCDNNNMRAIRDYVENAL